MHRQRYNVDGHARYLTFSCFHGRQFLTSQRARTWFLDALADARATYRFDLWGWVIMPDHAHLLILPQRGQDVSRILSG